MLRMPLSDSAIVDHSKNDRLSNQVGAFTNLFIQDVVDARVVIEACIHVPQPKARASSSAVISPQDKIASGTVIVWQDSPITGQVNRYRDCMSWCRSQMKGHFLLYREVAPIKRSKRRGPSNTQSPKHRRFWETVLGPSPEHGRYICSVIRGKNKFVQGGLCKRTISLFGSNGIRYRVISYFYITDVERFYDDDAVFHVPCVAMDKPSSLPQFLPFLEKARLVQKSSVMGTTAAAHSPEE